MAKKAKKAKKTQPKKAKAKASAVKRKAAKKTGKKSVKKAKKSPAKTKTFAKPSAKKAPKKSAKKAAKVKSKAAKKAMASTVIVKTPAEIVKPPPVPKKVVKPPRPRPPKPVETVIDMPASGRHHGAPAEPAIETDGTDQPRDLFEHTPSQDDEAPRRPDQDDMR